MEKISKVATMKCPQCRGEFEVFTREDHAFWPEGIIEVIMKCKSCGYRSVDVYPTIEQEPNKQELLVTSESDLKTRVVKSSKAIIRIPELGIEIIPGAASQGYITNVEGVLDRVEAVLHDMMKWKKPGAKHMLERIHTIRDKVSEAFTLIIEDPSGCSLIISNKTKRFKL